MICKKPYIITIPGTRNENRLLENAGSADIELSASEVQKLDEMLDKIPMSEVYGGVRTRSAS